MGFDNLITVINYESNLVILFFIHVNAKFSKRISFYFIWHEYYLESSFVFDHLVVNNDKKCWPFFPHFPCDDSPYMLVSLEMKVGTQ